jgi:hypothetical protein
VQDHQCSTIVLAEDEWVGYDSVRKDSHCVRPCRRCPCRPHGLFLHLAPTEAGLGNGGGGCSGGIGYHMSLSTLDDAGVCQLFVYKQIKNQQPSLMVIDDWC